MSLNVSKNYSPTILERSIFLGQIFFSKVLYDKKTYILIFVSILPLLPALTLNTATVNDYLNIIIISQETNIFNFAILPLICLILGISAIADEKENKTISQLLSRPVKREEIVLVKWISVVVIGCVIVCLDALIIYIGLCIIVQDFSILFEHLDVLIGVWLFLGMWVIVYGTIFLFLGIIIDKNALGWGLAIAYFEAFFGQFIFGAFAGNTPYSISNHLYFITAEIFLVDYFRFRIPDFEPINSLLICIGLIVGFLLLSLIVMRRKDFP
ncbi:MAG: ABC transporter permease subunit [Candidatus Hodarchaeota archaeon]